MKIIYTILIITFGLSGISFAENYSTYGNTTYDNNGNSWSTYGNTTYG